MRVRRPTGLRDTASGTEARISGSWNDLQSSWADHIAEVRQNIDAKKTELDATSAARRADIAEEDALFAIDYAHATIEEAEYAVLDAVPARMDADELAANSPRAENLDVESAGLAAQASQAERRLMSGDSLLGIAAAPRRVGELGHPGARRPLAGR
jgi:hypothetical protein